MFILFQETENVPIKPRVGALHVKRTFVVGLRHHPLTIVAEEKEIVELRPGRSSSDMVEITSALTKFRSCIHNGRSILTVWDEIRPMNARSVCSWGRRRGWERAPGGTGDRM